MPNPRPPIVLLEDAVKGNTEPLARWYLEQGAPSYSFEFLLEMAKEQKGGVR